MGDTAHLTETTTPPDQERAVIGTIMPAGININVLDTRWAFASDANYKTSKDTWISLLEGRCLPKHVETPERAMALAEAGRTHGWGPIQSCRLLCLIEGQVAMTANGMWMLVMSHAASEADTKVKIVERSLTRAAISVVRPRVFGDGDPVVFEFTQEDAVTAGLWMKKHGGKDSPWVLYPKAMLLARCKGIVARDAFGDVTFGAYTDEELISAAHREAADEIVGAILERKPKPTSLDELAATKGAAPAAAV